MFVVEPQGLHGHAIRIQMYMETIVLLYLLFVCLLMSVSVLSSASVSVKPVYSVHSLRQGVEGERVRVQYESPKNRMSGRVVYRASVRVLL